MAGSREIEELTGEWLEVYEESVSEDSQLKAQIAKVHAFREDIPKAERIKAAQKTLYTWAQDQQILHIPLKFFFEDRGRALALSKLPNTDLYVDIEFRSKEKLIQKSSGDYSSIAGGAGYQKGDLTSDLGQSKGEIAGNESCLVVEYHTVNQDEREDLQRNKDPVLLYPRTQFSGAYTRNATGDLSFDPKLTGPVNKIILAEQTEGAVAANSIMDFTGSMLRGKMSDDIRLYIENSDFEDGLHAAYRKLQHKTRTGDSSITMIPFNKHPIEEDNMAMCGGGALDMDQFDHNILVGGATGQEPSRVFCWGQGAGYMQHKYGNITPLYGTQGLGDIYDESRA